MWSKREWHLFYLASKRSPKLRPPRPVDRTEGNRLSPTEGYSPKELNDAGMTLMEADSLGLPIDVARNGACMANVVMLAAYTEANRRRTP
jgi:ribosomal protein L13E